MRDYKLWIVLLTLPAVGFTNCSDFSDVTVPAVDTTKPIVGSRVYEPGDTDGVIQFGNVSYQTQDYDGHWILAPYGYDSGGVHMLSVGVYADKRCCQTWDPNICAWTTSLTQTLIDSESANVGDTVSNGRYFYFDFSPSSSGAANCDIIRFGYTFQAMDFAGYLSSGSGSVTYTAPPPPPSGGGGGGFPPITGGTGSSGGCDESANTPCSAVPAGCQFGFQVQGTWQCINGNDKCVLPPEGVAGSYCSGPWTNTPNLCGRGLASQHQYGSACTLAGVNSRCMPGTACKSGLDPQHGAGCGVVPACGTLADCWHVDDNVNICSVDDWR